MTILTVTGALALYASVGGVGWLLLLPEGRYRRKRAEG
jgi:hypothetical protein